MSNQDNIKVSVIMPIYNAYSYLRPAMDSVLDQTLTELEVICVDDGSTDRSLDILKEYQGRDSRVRILTENNAGPSWARNKGLARARGEYVIFLDADDFFELDLLEKLYTLAERDNLDIAICEYDLYNDRSSTFEKKIKAEHEEIFQEGEIISKSTHPNQIFQCTTNYVWNKFFRRSFLLSKELSFHPVLRVFEDVYFVMTSLAMADRIGKTFDCLIHHRVYSEQSKNRFFRKYYHQVPELYEKIKEFLMHNGMYLPLLRSFLNLSASRCFKIYNLLWIDVKGDFWDNLHNSYAERLGWEKALGEEIESEDVREFVGDILLHDHKQHLKHTEKGEKTAIEDVPGKLSFLKIRKKIADFFLWIFGKKNNNDEKK